MGKDQVYERGIRLTKIYGIPESRQDDKYAILEFVNEANARLVPQIFVNLESGSFIVNLILFTAYERLAFGRFLETFQRGIEKIWEVPNAENIFKPASEDEIRQ